ncbi:XdhC/CoxI family protein [Syntrophomonas wolfei]|uniref:Xanthine and CO dehydrogenases maturation factor XdhC/CoxF family-like protein n=1 Tax=Syntrophomonas wolfei subsp. wolfei (strain DSM 2245B / Goettingen) TaxID=335541 RepID=Q0AXV6_SYNWW|nr:XdhC/CoxI family protein [Syntrophomonas wolfei]ABI68448.1 Xanthine and CO dehydrogenases maturation factor XdhC/CoxF family-like protein [Syntrophomonas wolfei subsp. wolfei str. Goettingen G311]
MEFDQAKKIVVATIIDQQGLSDRLVGCKAIITSTGRLSYSIPLAWVRERLEVLIRESLYRGSFEVISLANPNDTRQKATLMIDPYLPPQELIILGGGHIAQPLAKIGKLLGYQVAVLDDRPEFVSKDRFPEADKTICCSFDTVENSFDLGPQSNVVIVTRGHQHDLLCLRQMLKYPLAYLGMIGSRRKVAIIRERLLEEGLAVKKLNSVYMPIGLDIGAQTPAEIAVSITAELIKVRRGGKAASIKNIDKKNNDNEAGVFNLGELPSTIDQEILQLTLQAAINHVPAALATVVSTKGSTPRKAGAHMLVWADGRSLGTVGGGQGEAKVRAEAFKIINTSQPILYRISMDAANAAMEGMICGGSMEVFIEPVNGFAQVSGGGGIL